MLWRRFVFIGLLFLLLAPLLLSQTTLSADDPNGEPSSFVGMQLEELFARFGLPGRVYAARGEEDWQDDVVFVYGEGDFYIYRDRVWQVGITSIYDIKIGDAKAVALLSLGGNGRDEGDYLVYNIAGYGWPLSLRINFDGGKVSAMYVYRPDY